MATVSNIWARWYGTMTHSRAKPWDEWPRATNRLQPSRASEATKSQAPSAATTDPLAVAAMLVAMYRSVRGAAAHSVLFAGFYVANAFHAYADRMIVGLGWVIFEEREEYETLKYVCVSLRTFLLYSVSATDATGEPLPST